jgi:hypothetical protein
MTPTPDDLVSGRRLVRFLTDRIPPPAPLYVSSDDVLLVQVNNTNATSPTVNIGIRFLSPDGQLMPQLETIVPSSSGAVNTKQIPMQEGFLLGLVVSSPLALMRGECFVSVYIVRGFGLGSQATFHKLSQGYVTIFDSLAWPGGAMESSTSGQGNLRSITGTAVGAGVDISEVVPGGRRWRLLTFRAQLTASAAVANRAPSFQISESIVRPLYAIDPLQAQTASQAFVYNWARGIGNRFANVGNVNQNAPIPDMLLFAGNTIKTVTANLQAGDQWGTPQYLVEEWFA